MPEPAILVTILAARGSTPREAGAWMLVREQGIEGTIGGGQLELQAVEAARRLLAQGIGVQTLGIPLGPEIGQCCGGHVTLRLEPADAAVLARLRTEQARQAATLPRVLLFGAGHVGKALAHALAPLPLRVRWIDERAHEFPASPPVEVVVTDRLLDEVAGASSGTAYFVITHSHGLDFAVCEAVLRRGDFAYLGLIGSATKRSRFERGFRELGLDPGRLTCPIGGALKDKRPAVIAALAAAEVITVLARSCAGEARAA